MSDAPAYTLDDVRRAIGQKALSAGQAYQARGRVVSFEVESAGSITSRVVGSERRPYEQGITISAQPNDRVVVSGHCSCPVGHNCKHVAAALIEGLTRARAAPLSVEDRARQAIPLTPHGSVPTIAPQTGALPPDVSRWLDDLDKARTTSSEDYPDTVAQRLVYVLSPTHYGGATPRLCVASISTRLRKDGHFSGGGRTYDVDARSAASPAKFLRPSDLRILAALSRIRRETYRSVSELFGEAAATVLADMLATGRVRWLDVNGPALAAGKPRHGRIAWVSESGEALRPRLEVGDGIVVLNAMPPVYVDPAAGLVGAVETGLAPKMAATLLEAPPVPAGHVSALNAALAQRAPDLVALRPPEPETTGTFEGAPVPVLRLSAGDLPVAGSSSIYRGYPHASPREQVALARLSFRYGDITVPLGETASILSRLVGRKLVEVKRDLDAERRHLVTLFGLGLSFAAEHRPGVPVAHARDLQLEGDAIDWFDLLYHDVPTLRNEGWSVEVAGDFPFRVVRGDGALEAELREGSGIDWFELDLGVEIDGERIDLVGPLVALIARSDAMATDLAFGDGDEDEPVYLPLADGRVLAIPAARLLPIAAAIAALALGGLDSTGRLRLTPADAAALAEFETATAPAGLVWRGGERLRQMGRKLSTAGGIPPVTPPPWFRASLRQYQAEGVSWLCFLREVGLGGVLADDMGLGKTVQTLALVAVEKAAGRLDRPALVVAPTSLMENWRGEAERFAPTLKVLMLQGDERRTRFGQIGASDLVLTTYPLIARDHAVLAGQSWHVLILDEAQAVKNAAATTTKLIAGLDARHRFCLTGTPVENNLGDLWSLFSLCMPGLLGDRQSFTRLWRTPIEKGGDVRRGKLLSRRVRPFLLRRTKDEVARDLPAKTQIVERIAFGPGQRDIYESIRLSMHRRVQDAIAKKGFARSRIVILDALLKLRQACCDPRLLKLSGPSASKAGSAKLERLEEMLVELLAEGRRILVFSQFTSMLDLIRPRLDAAGIRYALLTGDTRDRPAVIRCFQNGAVPVFLVSLKAGGTGLNLTAADAVILYDPWWNPAVEEQAIDRVHRIGQDKPVFVHKLVAIGTIEEKMEVLKDKKRALADSLFDHDGQPTLAMTQADLETLFDGDGPPDVLSPPGRSRKTPRSPS